MTRRPVVNIAASVRAQLLALSRKTGEDFQFLLQRFAAERFLGKVQHELVSVAAKEYIRTRFGQSS